MSVEASNLKPVEGELEELIKPIVGMRVENDGDEVKISDWDEHMLIPVGKQPERKGDFQVLFVYGPEDARIEFFEVLTVRQITKKYKGNDVQVWMVQGEKTLLKKLFEVVSDINRELVYEKMLTDSKLRAKSGKKIWLPRPSIGRVAVLAVLGLAGFLDLSTSRHTPFYVVGQGKIGLINGGKANGHTNDVIQEIADLRGAIRTSERNLARLDAQIASAQAKLPQMQQRIGSLRKLTEELRTGQEAYQSLEKLTQGEGARISPVQYAQQIAVINADVYDAVSRTEEVLSDHDGLLAYIEQAGHERLVYLAEIAEAEQGVENRQASLRFMSNEGSLYVGVITTSQSSIFNNNDCSLVVPGGEVACTDITIISPDVFRGYESYGHIEWNRSTKKPAEESWVYFVAPAPEGEEVSIGWAVDATLVTPSYMEMTWYWLWSKV